MTSTRIIGDIHGDFFSYQMALSGIDQSIQLGDFFIGLGGNDYWHERINDFHSQNPGHRFIRGNHDDPARCKNEMVGWIPDGTIEGDTMLVGGAFSIDHFRRQAGVNWWEDEELSIEELYRLINLYAQAKPRIMITHDAPISVSEAMFVKTGLAIGKRNAKALPTYTGYALETMWSIHKPEIWMFGHWHHTTEFDAFGTHFHCLGLNDYVDFDLERLEYIGRSFV